MLKGYNECTSNFRLQSLNKCIPHSHQQTTREEIELPLIPGCTMDFQCSWNFALKRSWLIGKYVIPKISGERGFRRNWTVLGKRPGERQRIWEVTRDSSPTLSIESFFRKFISSPVWVKTSLQIGGQSYSTQSPQFQFSKNSPVTQTDCAWQAENKLKTSYKQLQPVKLCWRKER